jgi:alpha-L-arabinofuranosidase
LDSSSSIPSAGLCGIFEPGCLSRTSGGSRRDVIDALRELRVPGALARRLFCLAYHWLDGVGPDDSQRTTKRGGSKIEYLWY